MWHYSGKEDWLRSQDFRGASCVSPQSQPTKAVWNVNAVASWTLAQSHSQLPPPWTVDEKSEKMSLTPQYILQGFAYALEQCGLLLRDANRLYQNGAYASAAVLTAFAREELGRSSIL